MFAWVRTATAWPQIRIMPSLSAHRKQLQESLQALDRDTPRERCAASFAWVTFRTLQHSKVVMHLLASVMQWRFNAERLAQPWKRHGTGTIHHTTDMERAVANLHMDNLGQPDAKWGLATTI